MDNNKNNFNNEFSKLIWEQNYKAPTDNNVQETWKRIAKGASIIEKDKKNIKKQFYDILKDWKFSPGGRINANIGIGDEFDEELDDEFEDKLDNEIKTDINIENKKENNSTNNIARCSTTLMNCFVHHPNDIDIKDPDSIEGIYNLLKAQAHTLKSEGGYGTNFSFIRPKGCYVEGIGSRTPGVLKFMELWDKSSEIITMGGPTLKKDKTKEFEKKKIRKGAQMGVLNIWHPEIIDFIKAKQAPGVLTKFNLSVGITDGFMETLLRDGDWVLEFPDTTIPEYKKEWKGNLKNWKDKGYPTIEYETLKASKLWNIIMMSTYGRNEPGVLFLDLANKLNPLAYNETIETSNPCGEILMSTGVCNLGSMNLVKYVKKIDSDNYIFDIDTFKKDIPSSVRFLDNINDISRVPLSEYKNSMLRKRRIGLGVMGLGSLCYMLGIKYGSKESIELTELIYKNKCEQELLASALLGKEKGNFPEFNKGKYFSTYWWKNLDISPEIKKQIEKIGCMRNSQHSANAPNGNTSIYAGIVSGGIEPVFSKEYPRWVTVALNEQQELKDLGFKYPQIFNNEWFETEHMKFDTKGDEVILKGIFQNKEYEIDKNRGLCVKIECIDYGYKWAKDNYSEEKFTMLKNNNTFNCVNDLSVEDHINILNVVSRYTNFNSSKTVNIPEDYPYEGFKDLYLQAWKNNIKGITSYRAGTMTSVLEVEKAKTELEELFLKSNGNVITENVKLPNEYYSKGYNIKDINKKKWYINVAFADSKCTKPFGLFINTNCYESSEIADNVIESVEKLLIYKQINLDLIEKQREKYKGQSNVNKIARAVSMALRHNINVQDIINVLDEHHNGISTLLFHVKKILSKFIKDGTYVVKDNEKQICPSCNQSTLIYQEGCIMCNNCSWSKCG